MAIARMAACEVTHTGDAGRQRAMQQIYAERIYAETWAVLEWHFVTRPHLVEDARTQLAQCFTRLRAEGRDSPAVLKDLACRAIQLKFGPAPPVLN
jgi:hypothetical protein